ncbi:MAG TPA: lantibiotic dehydratase [Pyrinomonadaceae bacterium]|nr:lantibiotic dehydratase [Pyrinomonadaceae bacterium]
MMPFKGARFPVAFKIQEEPPVPAHLLPLLDEKWALWRCSGLRGAGFPASDVLRLSAPPDCAAAADRLLDAEGELREAHKAALEAVNIALDDLRSNQRWDDKQARAPLMKAMRLLKMSKLPGPLNESGPAQLALDSLRTATGRVDNLAMQFAQIFTEAVTQVSREIRELLSSDQFLEAIIWQNRQAFHTAVDMLRQEPSAGAYRGSKQRQHEELIANYWQRYCVKNDTIGFFGPVGWAKLNSQGDPLTVKPGPSLLASREVYFEWWSINALAQTFAANDSVKPWLTPNRVSYIHQEGANVYTGSGHPMRISAKEAAVLHACDGRTAAKKIAADLTGKPPFELQNEKAVYHILEELCAKGLATWSLELPIELHPERTLQRILENVKDARLREPALLALAKLIAARDRVAQAAGDAQRLDDALRDMETTFTQLTGMSPTRLPGEIYAARTLVYEDCRRNVEVDIGPQIVESLGAALSLILTSARWYTYRVAREYQSIFETVYAELVRRSGSPVISAVEFWVSIKPLLYGDGALPTDQIALSFQRRWAEILSLPAGIRRINYDSGELKPRVLAAFDAPHAGWSYARYHSPDLMISAASAEAIRRGDYQFVLGEIHIAVNTLSSSLFVAQHPSQKDLFRAVESDFPEPRVIATVPMSMRAAASRTRLVLESEKDFYLLLTHDSFAPPGSKAIPAASLVVQKSAEGLVIRTRDDKVRFGIIEVIGDVLSSIVLNSFGILGPQPYQPRITIDRLVVCRETWRFSPKAMDFAFVKEESERFIAARRWSRTYDLPRFAFVKVPIERKPFYVDFDSPIYVNILAKMIRRTMDTGDPASEITVSEMLPSIDEVWLPDSEGRCYASEFRIVAVDLKA